jgi:hypothetical protein
MGRSLCIDRDEKHARVVDLLSKTNVGILTKEWRERAGGVARGENIRARREPTARRNMIASSFAFSSISFALVSAAASPRFDSRVPLPMGRWARETISLEGPQLLSVSCFLGVFSDSTCRYW